MFTGGEDCTARIWDLKMRNLSCQVSCWTNITFTEYGISRCEVSLPTLKEYITLSTANLPSERPGDLRLPAPQPAGDGGGRPVGRHTHLELAGVVASSLVNHNVQLWCRMTSLSR